MNWRTYLQDSRDFGGVPTYTFTALALGAGYSDLNASELQWGIDTLTEAIRVEHQFINYDPTVAQTLAKSEAIQQPMLDAMKAALEALTEDR